MSNTELLEKLGTLRGQVAQMTDAPWGYDTTGSNGFIECEGTLFAGGIVGDAGNMQWSIAAVWGDYPTAQADLRGIAALRNAADELLAAVEAALPALEALREEVAKECVCSWCVTAQRALETADAALDRLAKKLEGL